MNNQKFVELTRRFPSDEPEREARIHDEITVDAYGDEEVTSSWYYYLEDKLNFPFLAMVQTHKMQHARAGMSYCASKVRVLGLAPLQRCSARHIWAMGILSTAGSETPVHILLTDLTSVDADEMREEALTDWMYWNRDRDFGVWELK